jgi:hypothetical protein
MHNADDHRDELFNFSIQGAGGQRSSAHFPKSAVDLGDPLPQGPALRIQVVEYVVVIVVLSHVYRLLRLWSAGARAFLGVPWGHGTVRIWAIRIAFQQLPFSEPVSSPLTSIKDPCQLESARTSQRWPKQASTADFGIIQQ